MRKLAHLFTKGPIARLLKEDDDSASHESGTTGSSLDAQVDRYLAQYEAAAKKAGEPSAGRMESIDWRDLVKGRVILEAGEENDKDEEGPGDAAPGADSLTGDDEGLSIDTIDVESFANDVVRLVENYDNLLEVRSTLVRRAKAFLAKTYDDDVVRAFEDTLRDDHGMEAGRSKDDTDNDRFPQTFADRSAGNAGPGPGGAPAG